MVPLTLIDEDPHQPRGPDNPGFSQQSISELAASYGPKGPKTPISLRNNPDAPGHYIINHGHRRYRAAKLRKLTSIPSFVDNDYSEIDQLIENLQRNELTAQEIAAWIGRELTNGAKKADIAKAIGKSAAFVSQHATLLTLPELVSAVIRERKLHDVTVINELTRAFKSNPDEVAKWLRDEHHELTRGSVRLLRDYLQRRERGQSIVPTSTWGDVSDTDAPGQSVDQGNTRRLSEKKLAPDKIRSSIVLVEHAGRPARLSLYCRPSAVGQGWLKYEDNGQEAECNLAEVKLVAVLEGNT